MYYLTLSILCSTLNHLLFKAFQRWNIVLLSAIVSNYLICIFVGYLSIDKAILASPGWYAPWFYFAVLQGCLFIGAFFLMGLATQRSGIGVAALATRLAVVLPTMAAFLLYRDSMHLIKGLGIVGAVIALYLSSMERAPDSNGRENAALLLPLLLFLFFGSHLTLAKYVQHFYLQDITYHAYVMFAFASAFVVGVLILAHWVALKKVHLRAIDLGAGVILGVNNYGSIYFMIRTLGQPGWESSVIFPIISVSVVILSFSGGYLLFKERVSRRKLAAIAIGLVAIFCISR